MTPTPERRRAASATAALLALCALLTITALTAASSRRTVVVIGASVSGGHSTSHGAAWPEQTDKRLQEADRPFSVTNASIGATRLLTRNDDGRPSALARQERDALAVPGVHTIVLTDVINDIQQTPHQYDPQVIINGFKEFVFRAHARGVRVVATTIPPYNGFPRYEPAGEHCRQTVNTYIRHSDLFDAVLDFDTILKDPADPTRLRPAYDSGDHLHPNDRGHHAIAEAIDLQELTRDTNW
ncbi:GDSL-type esterase/lipase family protein [Streptomyces sp. TX20-6-3]|uniref:GDSL-type esterase/lipase family protein n=1 Tax=Streptomyces sp. TX20-6-3 TaxID=3028705 RepID=UPI0029BCC177|nr:GDSL-type esterase/lipase family protein [Streptomyces sp. TX20-6-3]MDX2565319.1 GDSL-type esterase/lipase family protein [Streptomyces sp. TX20-6-3]